MLPMHWTTAGFRWGREAPNSSTFRLSPSGLQSTPNTETIELLVLYLQTFRDLWVPSITRAYMGGAFRIVAETRFDIGDLLV